MPLFAHGDAARCHGSAPCKSPDSRSEGKFSSSRTHPPFSRNRFRNGGLWSLPVTVYVTGFGVSLRSQCRSRGALHPIHF